MRLNKPSDANDNEVDVVEDAHIILTWNNNNPHALEARTPYKQKHVIVSFSLAEIYSPVEPGKFRFRIDIRDTHFVITAPINVVVLGHPQGQYWLQSCICFIRSVLAISESDSGKGWWSRAKYRATSNYDIWHKNIQLILFPPPNSEGEICISDLFVCL